MSGLLCGLQLRRAGWDVDIFERVDSELSGRGAGIVAQQELIARLRALGLDTGDLGVSITTRKVIDAQGRLTHTFDCPQVLTAWERVYRLLRDAFPAERYHRGRGLATFTQTSEAVQAHFSNGETVEADLLVGADGIRSTVRQQCLPDVAPLYAGYTAWRALIAESAFPPDVHRELFEYMSFGLPPGEQFLGYPVAGPDNDLRPGHRRFNVVWYRPADEKTKLQMAAHRRERGDARYLDTAALDLARGDRRDARRCRAADRAGVPPGGAADRGTDPAADLRSHQSAHGLRPRGDRGRRGLRGATSCRGRRVQGFGRCGGAGRGPRHGGRRRKRIAAVRGKASRREPPHHRARAPSRRRICRPRARKRNRRAPAATRPTPR